MSGSCRILIGEFGRVALQTIEHSIITHAHRQSHLLVKLNGPDIEFGIGDRVHPLGNNGLILLNAWEPHFHNHRTGDHPTTILEMCIEPRILNSIDRRFPLSSHPHFFSASSGSVPKETQTFVEELTDLITCDPSPSLHTVTTLVNQIVVTIARHFTNIEALSNYDRIGGLRCDRRLRKILANEQPLTVGQMVRSAGVSRPHFFHLFKQATRLTPNIFANMVRMENAIRMISMTKSSFSDIAFQLGFESPGNFTRFFRNQQGMSPTQYRRSVDVD